MKTMDGMELKPRFDRLQELFNRCVNHAFRVLTDRITTKSAYLDFDQMQELEKLEYIRTADELAQLYRKYPKKCIETRNKFLNNLQWNKKWLNLL